MLTRSKTAWLIQQGVRPYYLFYNIMDNLPEDGGENEQEPEGSDHEHEEDQEAQEEEPDAGAGQAPPTVASSHNVPLPTGMVPYKIQPFTGAHSEDAHEFLEDFCEYCRLYKLTNQQTKHLFVLCLRDRAKRWFRSTFEDVDTTDCTTIFEQFKQKFYQQGINWEKEIGFEALRQNFSEPVQSYSQRVEKAAAKLGKSDLAMLQSFVRGLLPVYKKTVLSRGPSTFEEAVRIATLLQSAEIVAEDGRQGDLNTQTLKELISQVKQMKRTGHLDQ